jgi:hypothetical protein
VPNIYELLAQASGMGDQEKELQLQLLRAQKLRDQQMPQRTSPGGAIFSGLARGLNAYRANQMDENAQQRGAGLLQQRQDILRGLPQSPESPEQGRSLARALAATGNAQLGDVGTGFVKEAEAGEKEDMLRQRLVNSLVQTGMKLEQARELADRTFYGPRYVNTPGDAEHSGVVTQVQPDNTLGVTPVGKPKPPGFNGGAGLAPLSDKDVALIGEAAAAGNFKPLQSLPRNHPGRAQAFSYVANKYGPDHPITKNMMQMAATGAALTQVTKTEAALRPYERMLQRNGEIVKQWLDKVPDAGVPMLNALVRSGALAVGSPEMSAFKAAVNAFSVEAARVLHNPNLNGVLAQEAKRSLDEIHNQNFTKAQLLSVIRVVELEAQNRLDELTKEGDALRASAGTVITSPNYTGGPAAPAAPAAPNAADPLGILR